MAVIESTGAKVVEAKYASVGLVAEAKGYKTCTIVASVLGLLPWQTEGGIVTSPRHLHVVAVDEGAVDGLASFLTKTCGAPESALDYRVYSLGKSYKDVYKADLGYNSKFRNDVMSCVDTINERAVKEKGVHVVLYSSFTTLAKGLQRELVGPPMTDDRGNEAKSSTDRNKWYQYGNVMSELQQFAQQDVAHVFWEMHLYQKMKDGGGTEESLMVEGKSGMAFASNIRNFFRIRRQTGQKWEKTNCDKVAFDTKPTLAFNSNGRAHTEALEPQEPCLTKAFSKMKLEVGGYKPREQK